MNWLAESQHYITDPGQSICDVDALSQLLIYYPEPALPITDHNAIIISSYHADFSMIPMNVFISTVPTPLLLLTEAMSTIIFKSSDESLTWSKIMSAQHFRGGILYIDLKMSSNRFLAKRPNG